MNTSLITDQQWRQYERDGYLRLGQVLTADDVHQLQHRLDDIMLGRADLDYSRLMMQLDSATGAYSDAGAQTLGFKGATLDYRKMERLEFDPLFLAYMQCPLFRDICVRVYGPNAGIRAFRAMFMNKPAGKGTYLPWHQDRWTLLDRDPVITVWTAIDPATKANGCVQVIPGSHHRGLINPDHQSGFLTPAQVAEHCPPGAEVHLELAAGEAVLLHNWLLHGSDINRSPIARRAFSVCYMDAAARHVTPSATPADDDYILIFGPSALTPDQLKTPAN